MSDGGGEAKEARESREESRTQQHFIHHLSIGRADPQDGRRKKFKESEGSIEIDVHSSPSRSVFIRRSFAKVQPMASVHVTPSCLTWLQRARTSLGGKERQLPFS
jgi:hypothetical protein